MVTNDMLMQFQADILDVTVVRPKISETTALGAAYAAGLAVGFWENSDDLRTNWEQEKAWHPQMDPVTRTTLFTEWKKAVTRTFDWVE
jgi:glycerol kinase